MPDLKKRQLVGFFLLCMIDVTFLRDEAQNDFAQLNVTVT